MSLTVSKTEKHLVESKWQTLLSCPETCFMTTQAYKHRNKINCHRFLKHTYLKRTHYGKHTLNKLTILKVLLNRKKKPTHVKCGINYK